MARESIEANAEQFGRSVKLGAGVQQVVERLVLTVEGVPACVLNSAIATLSVSRFFFIFFQNGFRRWWRRSTLDGGCDPVQDSRHG